MMPEPEFLNFAVWSVAENFKCLTIEIEIFLQSKSFLKRCSLRTPNVSALVGLV